MLLELSIRDFILMEDVTISFEKGLNILTGETGAGKSMLVRALELLLGRKAGSKDIRTGADKAYLSAVFDGANSGIDLAEFGLDTDDVIVLSREIRRDGRSTAYVNNRPSTLQTLKKIAERLLVIHGQNEQLELFSSEYQLAMLDKFSGHGMEARIAECFAALKDAEQELKSLEGDPAMRAQRLDYVKFQLDEIDRISPRTGEDEELEKEFRYLSNMENVAEAVGRAGDWLSNGDYPAVQIASEIAGEFRKLRELSEETAEIYEYASQAESLLSDFERTVRNFFDGNNFDQAHANEIQRRLDEINGLKRKYGASIDSIWAAAEEMREEAERLENIDEAIARAEERLGAARKKYDEVASALSEKRREAAQVLQKKITEQLSELNMPEAVLKIELSEGEPSRHGSDQIDFKIATAVGHELRSLKQVVSGGELSRIMLAVQVIVSQSRGSDGADSADAMLFDEVDAGISGITASIVGEKLSRLSTAVQLVCVTHLPQIAVFADNHILIEKESDDKQTVTSVKPLDESGRIAEISRLSGGMDKSDITIRHAEEMLKSAEKKKKIFAE